MRLRSAATALATLGLVSVSMAQKARFVEPAGFRPTREIAFRSFDMVDAAGRRIGPQTLMELSNGRVVTAQAFYDSLNRIERGLNRVGHSLRESTPNIVLSGNYADQVAIQRQWVDYTRSAKPVAANVVVPRRAMTHSKLRPAEMATRGGKHLGAFGSVTVNDLPPILINGTSLGNNPTTSYHWGFNKPFGDNSIGVRLTADVMVTAHSTNTANPPSLKGATTTISTTFDGGCQGTLLGSGFDILDAKCQLGTSSATGKVSVGWTLKIGGYPVLSDTKSYDASYTWNDAYSIPFQKQSQTMEFPIFGPFACSGFVGVEGEAGIKANLALNPIYAEAEVIPFVKAGVFGEVDAGLDLEVASAWGGLHADLTLVNDEFTLGANIGIVAMPNNKVGWRDELYVTNKLSLFTGTLSLVAHVFGPGGVKLQDFSYPFYTIPGYTDNRTLYQTGTTNPLNWLGN